MRRSCPPTDLADLSPEERPSTALTDNLNFFLWDWEALLGDETLLRNLAKGALLRYATAPASLLASCGLSDGLAEADYCR